MNYLALKNQIFSIDIYSIVPIRFEDRYLIMKWRNEQMYHLRQDKPLTKENQDLYFNTIIQDLFNKITPNQILFSYIKNKECVGYGGLVHINWEDRNAEISFIMKTELEIHEFELHWNNFLKMINNVAFKDLNLMKIFTYAYDLRPRLYNVLNNCNYKIEAKLVNHKIIENKFIDVIIHSKLNEQYIF